MRRFAQFALFVVILGAFVMRVPVRAQSTEPQLLITWRAVSYVPPFYQGKILPTSGSRIVASFDLIDQGRVVDVSRYTIYWYVNGELVEEGRNRQTIELLAPGTITGTLLDLRVQLPDYKKNDVVLKTITIPVVRGDAVIEAPFPALKLPPLPASLKAYPFFFNVFDPKTLSFEWTVDGKVVSDVGQPGVFEIAEEDVSGGATASVGLQITNPRNQFEGASKSLVFDTSP